MSAQAQQGTITLNLKDADINAVVELIARETGRNFVVDPRVKGKVTIVSSHPMTKDETYEVFLSVLDVHGFVAVPAGGIIKIVPAANAKMMSGESRVGGDDAFITQVIHVKNVSAAQMVPILRPLVPPNGHMAAHPQSNTLVISATRGNIERMIQIIDRIDQPTSGDVEAIQLTHASAAEVMRVLLSMLAQDKKTDPQISQPIVVADERTNTIFIGGEVAGRLQLRAMISHLDTPTESIGNTHVIYLRYAKAKDLVPVLSGVADSQVKEKIKNQPNAAPIYHIQAEDTTNTLVLTAPPDVFKALSSVVRQLDVRRAQVLVEAIIAEVSSDRAADLGVQWLFDGSPKGSGPVGSIAFGKGSGGNILEVGGAALAGQVPVLDGMLVGAGKFNDPDLNFAVLLRALEGDGATNVLSTPSVVTLDNQAAEIVVGQQVPFVTGSFSQATGTGGAVNPFQTIKRENVGITLKVVPQINEGSSIKLDIEQSVDSINTTAKAADIVTNTRSIKTSVLVDDGKMIVLGGLIKDDLLESESKVPLLGDIPLLGMLFRSKTAQKIKTNLMIFLKPTILRDLEDSVRVTSAKYNYIRNKQLLQYQEGVSLLDDERVPVLPRPGAFLQYTPADMQNQGATAPAEGEAAGDTPTEELFQHE
ncbi:MAG: type II secretion system secretin GspD [Pseudomonadota bacterium]